MYATGFPAKFSSSDNERRKFVAAFDFSQFRPQNGQANMLALCC
jgi:hypothetical protein